MTTGAQAMKDPKLRKAKAEAAAARLSDHAPFRIASFAIVDVNGFVMLGVQPPVTEFDRDIVEVLNAACARAVR